MIPVRCDFQHNYPIFLKWGDFLQYFADLLAIADCYRSVVKKAMRRSLVLTHWF
ncbi:MAG: hypothetical protein WBB82_03790 [Limnothrix sp.]